MGNMKNKKIIGVGVISLIIIMLSSIFIYASVIKPKRYDEYMSLGNKYLLEENYGEAILVFEKAIKIDKKSIEARVCASKGYIGVNDLDKALAKLEEAQNLDKTNENLVKEIIDILIGVDSDVAYKFLYRFVEEVGSSNISKDMSNLLEEANELPSEAIVSPKQGKYIKSISVKLKSDKTKIGHSYYYTIDGSEPNKKSLKYTGKIDVTESMTIRIIGYNKNNEETKVTTLKYIIDESIIAEIKSSISNGEKLIANTTIGNKVGNISKDDKDKLEKVIKESNDLLNKNEVKYKVASNMKDKLEKSISEFKDNIIKPVDKSKLESAISRASKLYNKAVEGSSTGQYKAGSKNKFLEVINRARNTYENVKNQNTVDRETNILNQAINNFESKKVKGFTVYDAIDILQDNGYFLGRDYEYVKGNCLSRDISTGEIICEENQGIKYYSFWIDHTATNVLENGSIFTAIDEW